MDINMIFLATVDRGLGTAVKCSQQFVAKQKCFLVSYQLECFLLFMAPISYVSFNGWNSESRNMYIPLVILGSRAKILVGQNFIEINEVRKDIVWQNLTAGIKKCIEMRYLRLTSMPPRYFSWALIFSASPDIPDVLNLLIEASPFLLFCPTFPPELQS